MGQASHQHFISPCMHSMDHMGKTVQGFQDTTTAWWENVSVQLGGQEDGKKAHRKGPWCLGD